MNIFRDIFSDYEALVARADNAFRDVREDCGDLVRCYTGCSDCCHSVFGLFLVESVYLKAQFDRMDRKFRREALIRGDKADRELQAIEEKLGSCSDQQAQSLALARERVRCPLLEDKQKCLLYSSRPITCRVYGIPAIINGKVHSCWKAGFENDKKSPAFDLDGAYRELYGLSKRILERVGQKNMERASLLVSLSKSISTPLEKSINI